SPPFPLRPDIPLGEPDAETHTWDSANREGVVSPQGVPSPSSPEVLDVDRLRDAMAQLAHGLSALHEAGKLHRDIKPSNVLVTHEGRVLLLDFGHVTKRGLDPPRVQLDAHVLGTATYMSP